MSFQIEIDEVTEDRKNHSNRFVCYSVARLDRLDHFWRTGFFRPFEYGRICLLPPDSDADAAFLWLSLSALLSLQRFIFRCCERIPDFISSTLIVARFGGCARPGLDIIQLCVLRSGRSKNVRALSGVVTLGSRLGYYPIYVRNLFRLGACAVFSADGSGSQRDDGFGALDSARERRFFYDFCRGGLDPSCRANQVFNSVSNYFQRRSGVRSGDSGFAFIFRSDIRGRSDSLSRPDLHSGSRTPALRRRDGGVINRWDDPGSISSDRGLGTRDFQVKITLI